MLRPVRLEVPRGSLLSPEPGTAMPARQAAFVRVAAVVMGCLSRSRPDRAPALGRGQGPTLFPRVPGLETARRRVAIVQPLIGGSGARPFVDGTDGVDLAPGFDRNIPSAIDETEMPALVRRYGLRPDSGGPGAYRGGCAIVDALPVLPPEAVLTSLGSRNIGTGTSAFQNGSH